MTAPPTLLEIEQATLSAVPAPILAFDGPFVVRRFLGGTGRANAACGLDPGPDPELPARIARIEAFYASAGQVCRFRSTALDPEGLAGLLQARGYTAHDESQVITGPLAGFARSDPDARILSGPEPDWMEVVATAEHQSEARRAEKARMAELLGVPAAWVLLMVDGQAAASAFVTAQGRCAGLFDLAVRPEFRRRGLGQRVMAAAGAWAAGQGADWAYAQVSCANAASLAMNAGLGLREQYRYVYWLKRG
ncbi:MULTISPECIES: GNAT family N-acetyltransferase [Roseomonadaceae]|uniref:GNAT family N-acetyltransferase n=1 Tax=Falsiroseomonas oleicola TaxID=2801474 RepID=A0ABS6H707_9PROT|nr:GNAT family N-acetyltransferase [Roseomonas oleicola]MBU8544472.1 GNAT family N-acetyltransferase [Roseomonas oleicola]